MTLDLFGVSVLSFRWKKRTTKVSFLSDTPLFDVPVLSFRWKKRTTKVSFLSDTPFVRCLRAESPLEETNHEGTEHQERRRIGESGVFR